MASNAVLSDQRLHAPAPVSRAELAINEALNTRPRVATRAEQREVVFDLGLRAGVKANYRSGLSNEGPVGLFTIASAIREIEALPSGWDSYDGLPLDDGAVQPALELAIAGLQRCQQPKVVLRPNGGLGLRWQKGHCELEIDVDPNGTCIGMFEDLASGEVDEVVEGGTADQVLHLLHKLCKVA